MTTILITAGSSPLSRRVAKLLSAKQIYFADALGASFMDPEHFRAIPRASSSTFIHELLKLCLDLSVDTVIPLHEEELSALSSNAGLFQEYGVSVLLPEPALLQSVPRTLNPNRSNAPELQIFTSAEETSGLTGVYAKLPEKGWALCCVSGRTEDATAGQTAVKERASEKNTAAEQNRASKSS